MEFALSKNRSVKLALGFDDVSLEPSASTTDPEDVDLSWKLGDRTFSLPIIAAAMDAVVDPAMAKSFADFGSFAVMNLEGVWTRYEDTAPVYARIRAASQEDATAVLQQAYAEPIKEHLFEKRIKQLKEAGAVAAVSLTPLGAMKYGALAVESGAEILIVQSTVTSPSHRSSKGDVLSVGDLVSGLNIPVIVGNCVGYDVAYILMQAGVQGILVGVGPGAACTTRDVTGVGVPQITATADAAAARDDYFSKTGRYVAIITDGGMRKGGEMAKALAAGADALMIGSVFAGCPEAPGSPYHWGMATPHKSLPRGVRVKVSHCTPLEKTLFGPSSTTDGTQNLVGALKSSMGLCGADNIREFHKTKLVVSLSFMSEGKLLQRQQTRG